MIKVLVVHDTLHEAKKIEHYIISYYGTCSVLLCAGADKNEIMDIIENEDNEIVYLKALFLSAFLHLKKLQKFTKIRLFLVEKKCI